ncbi:hypothetical protein NP493_201g01001 [Ridgeia piscesae]|uniref:Uncharacterized protein n=1 Tax=Ridgeia piscesae TaxID=27915 RepID=A0AAD9P1G4_RIDPI|nr:hypothetical protein NP493_201g01001 [Ridgeia piscesae]
MYRYYKREMSYTEGGLPIPESEDRIRSKSAGWPPSNHDQQPPGTELPPVDSGGLVNQPSARTYNARKESQNAQGAQHGQQTKRSGLPFRVKNNVRGAFGEQNAIYGNADTLVPSGGGTGIGNPKIYFNKRTSNFVVVLPDGEMLEGRIFLFSNNVDCNTKNLT